MEEQEQTRTRPRRRKVLVAAVLGVLGAGALVGITSGGPEARQLAAWSIDGPSLPLPAVAPADVPDAEPEDDADDAPVATTTADDDPPSGRLPSGAAGDAEIEAELRQSLRISGNASTKDLVSRSTLTPAGHATVPVDAPPQVEAIIRAGNVVAHKPYVYGGGHGRFADSVWIDSAYDCSGSISYALAAAGLIDHPMVSGQMATDFEPGPGKWVTIYAHADHAYMYVAGLRFDTSGRGSDTGSRWQTSTRSSAGFHVVHPKGL
ncbi:MAG: C40 family peptidase [Solirubrobacteraceae bacterium]|nr:C40 family peptidase [Solirubrobacteraceae bacterium]